MKKMNSLQTIDDILLKEIDDYADYTAILKVIYCYYLNDSEREMYNASLLYYSGKTQKDIGILLNMHQPYFNWSFSKLIRKMKDIAKVLYRDRDSLIVFLHKLRNLLLDDQYKCIALLLGGNNGSDVARYLKYDDSNITRIKSKVFKRLSKEDSSTLKTYLNTFKKPYFTKK